MAGKAVDAPAHDTHAHTHKRAIAIELLGCLLRCTAFAWHVELPSSLLSAVVCVLCSDLLLHCCPRLSEDIREHEKEVRGKRKERRRKRRKRRKKEKKRKRDITKVRGSEEEKEQNRKPDTVEWRQEQHIQTKEQIITHRESSGGKGGRGGG